MQPLLDTDSPLVPTVLVVDDTPDNLALISSLLKEHCKVKVANSGEKALKYLESSTPPDLILLDIMMPGLSGYDVIKQLKSNPEVSHVPVIFLTAMASVDDEEKGFSLGAADYITKPISPSILKARVTTQLENKNAADILKHQNVYLESEVQKRTQEISAIQDVTIFVLASLAETRDSDTGNHLRRTQFYIKALALKLQHHPRFFEFLKDEMIETLYKSAPLHDIGKVGIPDHILLKPGKYELNEFEIMKRHTTLGKEAIEQAEKQLGMEVDFLKTAKEIAYSHHEKYDGSGYPMGLEGDAIPISARLMALADVYDALISRRIYKEGMNHKDALNIIIKGKGTHFDPDIVDAFLELQEEFQEIAHRFCDSDEDMREKIEQFDYVGKVSV